MMASRKQSKAVTFEAPSPNALSADTWDETGWLEPGVLQPRPDNRKVSKSDPGMKEFIAAIKGSGVKVPIHVRPLGDGRYEIVCGNRRTVAAKASGIERVPVMIHHGMTDEEAFELTFAENYLRKDLTPLEEGRAVSILLEKFSGDVRAAASKLGWSEGQVRRRARLASLVDEWRTAVEAEGSKLAKWTAAHLELIARYEPEEQLRLLKKYDGGQAYFHIDGISVAGLEAQLEDEMRRLKSAPWALDDAELIQAAGPCIQCMKRTGAKPDLFLIAGMADGDDGAIDRLDRCTDRDCWGRKMKSHVKRAEKAAAEKYGEGILKVASDYGASGKGVLARHEYDKAKKSDKGSVPALVVKGDKAGTVQWVKPKKQAKSADAKMTHKKLLAEAHASREIDMVRRAAEAIEASSFAALARRPGDRSETEVVAGLARLMALLLWDERLMGVHSFKQEEMDAQLARPVEDLAGEVWRSLAARLGEQLDLGDYYVRDTYNGTRRHALAFARCMAELLGLDWAPFEKAAEDAVPLPEKPEKAKKPKKLEAVDSSDSDLPKCRSCGCDELHACVTEEGPCSWVIPPGSPETEADGPLCSACELVGADAGR